LRSRSASAPYWSGSLSEGSRDQAIGHPLARSSSSASEDEQLLAEDEEFEIPFGSTAAAEDEEVNQQAKEGIEEGQQHRRAE